MLRVADMAVSFGPTVVIEQLDLEVAAGTAVALLGLNGAGKSVCLKAIGGLLPLRTGRVHLDEFDLTALPAERRAALGLAQVSQVRGIFANLTVEENLRAGAYAIRGSRSRYAEVRGEVLDLLPELATRLDQRAGTLSGGERTMLALGRALMLKPRVLLADEPSAALAPALRKRIAAFLTAASDEGLAIVFAEQNVGFALDVADEVHVLAGGRVTYSTSRADLDHATLTQRLREPAA